MKEDLRGAETWPDGDGTAGENEVMETQSCQGGEHSGVYVCTCTHTHAC